MNERAQLVTAMPMLFPLHDPFAGAVFYSAPKHHGWPDVPSQRKRRILERCARAMGATAARAWGAFPFPARPALPQGVATIPQRPAGRGILFSDPATAQRETVAPASRRPAAWRGPFHCPVVATAGSVPAEQPKDEATRRIDGAVQVATDTRSAVRPTGRRIVAGETSRGGGESSHTPLRRGNPRRTS